MGYEQAAAVKPLNSVERRELNKLIDQEFEMLRVSVAEMADREEEERIRQLNESYSSIVDAIDNARRDIEELEEKFNEELKSLITDYEARHDVRITKDRYSGRFVSIADYSIDEPKSLSTQRQDIRKETKRKQNAANRVLSRQALDLKRKVTLTGLTSEAAQEFVSEIPSAQDILAKAVDLEAEQQKELA